MRAQRLESEGPPRALGRLDLRRQQILDSAARIFAEKGYHEAGIADIAADLGIGHGTFYRYFASKEEIASRILDLVVQRITETMLREDPEASNTLEEYRAQVERIILRLFELLDRHPHLIRFFNRHSAVDTERLAVALDGFTEFTARFVRNGIAKRFLRDDLDVEISSQVLVAALLDLLRRSIRTPPSIEVRQRWLRAGVAMMFDGLSRR